MCELKFGVNDEDAGGGGMDVALNTWFPALVRVAGCFDDATPRDPRPPTRGDDGRLCVD